jgi:hypothetical protein
MTLDEAQKIAAIIGTADSGCPVCIGKLVDLCNKSFPDFEWSSNFDSDSDDDENDENVSVRAMKQEGKRNDT